MGLDSFWELPEGAEAPEFDHELRIDGDAFSIGGGGASFRGKIYNPAIREITGGKYSLYEDRMPNADVRTIADALESYAGDPPSDLDWREGEFDDLKLMFRTYADAGAELTGWY